MARGLKAGAPAKKSRKVAARVSTAASASAYDEERCTELEDFFRVITSRLSGSSKIWFRGAGKRSHTLLPGLYRHKGCTTYSEFDTLEQRIYAVFRDRSIPFIGPPPGANGDWHLYFLMQHYRVPTRLLDWSESPFIALYFALTAALHGVDDPAPPSEDAIVWMIDPVQWNKRSLRDVSRRPADLDVLTKDAPILASFAPGTTTGAPYAEPLAMFGMHNSPRIVAQRGTFTISGTDVRPLDVIFVDKGYPRSCLSRVVIPPAAIRPMLSKLVKVGYTDSVIFPDLEGLAQEIRRQYGF